jgi:uncharacterized membrane protein YeaQ/YmgE (transglycosylase-associated protein family)
MEILWFLLIGLIEGWLASHIVGAGGFGLIGDIVLGVVGAFIGGYIFRFLHITTYGLLGDILMAVIGAIVLLAVIRMVRSA